jgi:hypothetical protein
MKPFIYGAVAAGLLAGCSNAGEDLGFEPLGNGTVAAFIYLDRNGDLTPSGGADTAFAGVRLGLVVAGTTDTVFSANTDALGNVVFSNVPFGNYRFVVDSNTVADSIQIQAIDSANVRLTGNAQQQLVTIRLGYPALTISEARVASTGLKVFIKGMMLVGIGSFGDTTAHIIEDGVAIRLTNATNGGPAAQVADSARVSGTISVRGGQPVLDHAVVVVYKLGFTTAPFTALTTMLANNADTTAQDAALVGVTGALVTDTATVNGDFNVGVDDGSGRVVIVLDGDLTFPLAQIDLGDAVTARGLLVPTGSGTWVLKPRSQTDITIP